MLKAPKKFYFIVVVSMIMLVICFLPLNLNGGLSIPLGLIIVLQVFWHFQNFDINGVPKRLPISIPFTENHRGRINIVATLQNGRQTNFIFDTGAPHTCVSNQSFLHPIPLVGTKVITRSMSDLFQTKERECGLTPWLAFRKLSFSYPWVLYFDSKTIRSGTEFAGMLGSSYFANCEVTIDRENSLIYVRKADSNISKNWCKFEVRPYFFPFSGPLIVIPGTLENRPVKFLLDTGCSGTLIPPRIAYPLELVKRSIPVSGHATIYKSNKCAAYLINNLTLDSQVFKNVESTIVLVDNLAQNNCDGLEYVLLGTSFLKHLKSISIDYPNKKIKFVSNYQ